MRRIDGWSSRIGLAVGLAIAWAGHARGAGTIFNGDVHFVRSANAFGTAPACDFTGVVTSLSADELFETGWWYRTSSGTSEVAFPTPTSQDYSGIVQSLISWNDVSGLNLFDAVEQSSVSDLGSGGKGDGGLVTMQMTITNRNASSLSLHLFHEVDFDVQPGATDDSAKLAEYPSLIEIKDAAGDTASYLTTGSSGWLVRPNGGTDVGAVLSDGGVTDFNDSGLPFGPGDATAGFQFDLVLGSHASKVVTVYLAVNHSLRCGGPGHNGVFCDGFESSNKSLWTASAP